MQGGASLRSGWVSDPALSAVFYNGNSKTTTGAKARIDSICVRRLWKGRSSTEHFRTFQQPANTKKRVIPVYGPGVRGVTGECEWDHRFGVEFC